MEYSKVLIDRTNVVCNQQISILNKFSTFPKQRYFFIFKCHISKEYVVPVFMKKNRVTLYIHFYSIKKLHMDIVISLGDIRSQNRNILSF